MGLEIRGEEEKAEDVRRRGWDFRLEERRRKKKIYVSR